MPLVAADETPKQVPLEAHGSFSIVLSNEDNLFLFPVHPPSPPGSGLLPSLCSYFPSTTRGSCRLNCLLLLHLCTCQMRSESNQVPLSAVLVQIKSKYLFRGTWLEVCLLYCIPYGVVILSLSQGYKGSWRIRTAFKAESFPLVVSMNISPIRPGV